MITYTNHLLNILTISISPNRTNWPNNKIKRGNLHLQHAYHYIVKIKQKIPSQWRTTEERMDKEYSFKLEVLKFIIIHQTHYEKSDWSRAFNQFIMACELDMINAISAADIAFIMSSSTSAWLLSPLECSPQKQNDWTVLLCFWGWIMWKMCKKIIEFGFRMISWIIMHCSHHLSAHWLKAYS